METSSSFHWLIFLVCFHLVINDILLTVYTFTLPKLCSLLLSIENNIKVGSIIIEAKEIDPENEITVDIGSYAFKRSGSTYSLAITAS